MTKSCADRRRKAKSVECDGKGEEEKEEESGALNSIEQMLKRGALRASLRDRLIEL